MKKTITVFGLAAATLISPVQAKDVKPIPRSPLARELFLVPPDTTRECIRVASDRDDGIANAAPLKCIRMGKSMDLTFVHTGEKVRCYVERRQHSPEEQALIIMVLENDKVVAGVQSTIMESTKATLDAMIADPKPGRVDWWWCDALFMAPPVLARLYTATGDQKYLKFLNTMWWDTTDFLFDPAENLYYRDKNYIGKLNANGKKIFWARGNGWVMGGTVRVLQHLPKNDPNRQRYIELLQKMAAAVSKLQGADGLWRPSLLDPTEAPVPETSSTGFFCYAMTWGINQGYLDRKTYTPVVRKAWQGLLSAVHEDGKLGWVQPIGAAPASVTADLNQEYGSGAFLLAGGELMKLK